MRLRQRLTYLSCAGLLACAMGTLPVQAQTSDSLMATTPLPPGNALPSVLTQHNDNARTGANLQETILNINNVKAPNGTNTGFGKLFTRKVDGEMYAQPLYVPGLTINGVKRNVVFLATMHSSVYAFDADDPAASEPLWKTAFLDPNRGIYPCPIWEVGGGDTNIWPEVGIVSTPVIDLRNNYMYCVTKTKERQPDGSWRYPSRLRKLDIRTGKEIQTSGLEITATVKGTGDGANGDGTLTFDPARQMNRPGLLLQNDILYIAFGSHSDITPYHGWVFAYNAKYMYPLAVWCSTPNGKTNPNPPFYPIGAGGIWMSGQGLVADANNNVYLEIGNGTFSANTKDGVDYGDSFVKVHLNTLARPPRFEVVDYFTPYDQDALNWADADLGVTGPMLVPNSNLMVGGGKGGKFYVLNRENMGGFNANGDVQIPQWMYTFPQHLHGSPVYWDSPAGSLVYVWGELDYLKAFKLDRTRMLFQTTPAVMGTIRAPVVESGMPGATLSVSANGNKAGTGIIWANIPYNDDAIHKIVPGVLRAFDAATLKELWNSKMGGDRDDFGLFAKFAAPTVVNGKVYLPTFSNSLAVYGLGKWTTTPLIAPQSGTYAQPVTVTITDTTPGAKIYYTTDGTEPTPSSAPYTGAFRVTPSVQVKAKAFANGFGPSGTGQAQYVVAGAGLTGQYFNGYTDNTKPIPNTPVLTEIDPQIDFQNWSEGAGQQVPPGVDPFNFAVRWTGKVQPTISGTYTFSTVSDDGVRLWVDGKLLVDNWTYHGSATDSNTITLLKGKKYDIRLEYFEGRYGAIIQLFWELPGVLERQIIPQIQLYSK